MQRFGGRAVVQRGGMFFLAHHVARAGTICYDAKTGQTSARE